MIVDVKARPICFYLPQFHRTAANNEAWGKGFTEWTNVAQGQPRYPGHGQPKVPGELGFYDLSDPRTYAEQCEIAKASHVYGFCFYHYRFGTVRELDLPVRSMLKRAGPTMPFCLCWANESWTRAWDGKSDVLLREQTYDQETLDGLIGDFGEAFRDYRYIRVSGRPLLLIYQIEHTLTSNDFLRRLREGLYARFKEEPLIAAVYSHGFTRDMETAVDMIVQFPPHRTPRHGKRLLVDPSEVQPFEPERKDYFEAYDAVVATCKSAIDAFQKLAPGVCPDWDNSVRRKQNAHMLIGSTPEKFKDWSAWAAETALRKFKAGHLPAPFFFVNAWNEWAEGAMLEPTWKQGRAYADALSAALSPV